MSQDRTHLRSMSLSRRSFHRLAAASAAGIALARVRSSEAADAKGSAERSPSSTLAHASGADTPVVLAGVPRGSHRDATEAAVRRAALETTDFSWLSRGDTVLIKVVCNSGNDYPATTDPLAVTAMVRLLKEKGAGRVIVADMSGVQFLRFGPDHLSGSTRKLMTGNGLVAAAQDAGAEVQAFEEQGWDAFYPETPRSGPSWRDPVMMPKVVAEADHVILMPRCSRHSLAGSTLGLKAAVGWWRHDSRLEYHHDADTFAQKTAESNTVPSLLDKQRLVLSSATKVLTTFGPDDGYIGEPETGLIIASDSIVAHDMISLAWLLESRAATPADERTGVINDPYESSFVVNIGNRVVVGWLGGLGSAFSAQTLTRRDIDTVWDDRVLARAFEVFAGVPKVALVNGNGEVPGELRDRLAAAVSLPAVTQPA